MAIQSAQELFQHELSDMYSAEQAILKMLPQLAGEVKDAQVKSALQMHEQQTQQQVQNLDQCFQLLGMKRLEHVSCDAVLGLKQEHESFLKEQPSETILTMFDLGAASKTEHYEIASYQGLIEKAQLMGQQNVVQLLRQNLRQEEEMAQKVSQLARELGRQQITPDVQSQTQTQTQAPL
jgi:ferritin-like metal-binding protein YciE